MNSRFSSRFSTIRGKLLVFSGLAVLLVALAGLAGFGGGVALNRSLDDVVGDFQTARRHLEFDMMHDALRADVLSALRAGRVADAAGSRAVSDDLKAHGKVFQDSLVANLASTDTQANAKAALAELKPLADAYLAGAENLASLAARDVQAAEAGYPEFVKLFKEIETRSAQVTDLIAAEVKDSEQSGEATVTKVQFGTAGITLVALIVLLLLATGLNRNIAKSLRALMDTIGRVAQGDYTARSSLTSADELGILGRTFDDLLGERVATLAAMEKDNEQLNASILDLLQAVAQLSRRDLTVKVPVTEGVTGTVADALNMLTKETVKVLQQVSDISADVSTASLAVKEQSDTVAEVARNERMQIDLASSELTEAAVAMRQIADLARRCDEAAGHASTATQSALQTVNATVGGINSTREIIRETEKRIKRLGERSQEISGVVSLINTIAERTHILALNASMHAASAGEAGRGFAVVADEVQRLAESARQATAQISTLVNNIQVETSDTANTMNAAISQVVEGSRLAEQAGEQMKRTQESTAQLVASVQQIAKSSQNQAEMSDKLVDRAAQIRRSTQETGEKLRDQTEQTEHLVGYARGLLSAVRIFKLPA